MYGFQMCYYNITSNKEDQRGYMIYFTLSKPFTTATLYSVHVEILITHVHIHDIHASSTPLGLHRDHGDINHLLCYPQENPDNPVCTQDFG